MLYSHICMNIYIRVYVCSCYHTLSPSLLKSFLFISFAFAIEAIFTTDFFKYLMNSFICFLSLLLLFILYMLPINYVLRMKCGIFEHLPFTCLLRMKVVFKLITSSNLSLLVTGNVLLALTFYISRSDQLISSLVLTAGFYT